MGYDPSLAHRFVITLIAKAMKKKSWRIFCVFFNSKNQRWAMIPAWPIVLCILNSKNNERGTLANFLCILY